MRPTRGLGSAPLPRGRSPTGCALLFGLAPGRVCRVSPAVPAEAATADSSLWHWSSPRGGRALPATLRCGARTFLEPPGRTGAPATIRPPRWPVDATATLRWTRPATRPDPERAAHLGPLTAAAPPARARSIASLASASAAGSGPAARGWPSSAGSRPAAASASAWSGASFASLTRQRPLSCSTISFESSSRSTSLGAQLARPGRAPGPRRCTRRRCWSGRPRYSRDRGQRRARRGRSAPGRAASIRTAPDEAGPGLPARRAVGADDQAQRRRRRPPDGRSSDAAQACRSTIAAETSRIARVMLMPRGQASTQLKIVRQRHTPSSSARISSRSSAPSSRESKMKRWALTIAAGPTYSGWAQNDGQERGAGGAQDALGRVVVAGALLGRLAPLALGRRARR